MTFILASGLQVRVPNSQFLTPFVEVVRNGSRIIDRSKRELLMNGLGDQPATLGRYFFTAAYLMVDYDASTFSMWQANPSTSSTLVPVSSKSSADCDGGGGSSNSGGSGPSSSPNPQAEQGSSASLSAGAIAGAVIGGICALAIAAAVFFVVRRRKHANLIASTSPMSDSPPEGGLVPKIHQYDIHEVHGTDACSNGGGPAELRADEELRNSRFASSGEWNFREQERLTLHELDDGRR